MSGLDGALLDEYTQGINAPANGQQGYAVFADQQAPRPNLEYKSLAESGALLKNPVAAAFDATSPDGASIAGNGTHAVTLTFAHVPKGFFEFLVRTECVHPSAGVQFMARSRMVIGSNIAGTATALSASSSEYTAGANFSLALTNPGGGNTIVATVTSTTATAHGIRVTINQAFRDAVV